MPPVTTRAPGISRTGPAPLLLGLVFLALIATVDEPAAAAEGESSQDSPTQRDQPAHLGHAPENGDQVFVVGQVTDARGEPVIGIPVVFEAFRSSFSLRRLERREKDFRRVETVTDADGRYRLEWLWDDYFNRFRVGVTVHHEDGQPPRFLDKLDAGLGRRLAVSGSALVPLVIEDVELVDALRRFEGSIHTDEQRRIYKRLGYPDEVQVMELAQGDETSWWYFRRGEVYRFVGGELQEMESFEPVRRF